jgi:hypothetical protein
LEIVQGGPIFKIPNTKRAGGVAQGKGLSTAKKKKKKKTLSVLGSKLPTALHLEDKDKTGL